MANSEKGFSTLEALVGMGLFALVMLGIGTLPVTTIHANLRARNVTAATNLARDKVEELRHAGYASLATGKDGTLLTESSDQGGSRAYYSRAWAVSSGSTPGTKEVAVTVAWTDTSAQDVTLTTVVADTE
jgi:Tfp pilus assembly protein PilV